MSYISTHLIPNEEIEHKGETSKLYLILPVILLLIAIVLLFLFASVADDAITFILLILIVISVISFFRRLFVALTSEFAITNKRIILKKGLISITVSDIALDKCDGISFSQGIWGRIFGYGSVETSSTGKKGQKFPALAKPYDFRSILFSTIEKYK